MSPNHIFPIVSCPKCANGTSNFTFVAFLLAQYFKMSTYCQSVQTAVYQLLLAFS